MQQHSENQGTFITKSRRISAISNFVTDVIYPKSTEILEEGLHQPIRLSLPSLVLPASGASKLARPFGAAKLSVGITLPTLTRSALPQRSSRLPSSGGAIRCRRSGPRAEAAKSRPHGTLPSAGSSTALLPPRELPAGPRGEQNLQSARGVRNEITGFSET